MDLSILLSIAAIVVSVIVSGITLLLTQFQGPDISLISTPKFEDSKDRINNDKKTLLKRLYPPGVIELEPASFLFANHGGKSGTILNVDLSFSPQKGFENFLDSYRYFLSLSSEQSSFPGASMPTTIIAGDNKDFVAKATIYLVDWKRKALAEVLDPGKKVQALVEVASLNSRKNFESFCYFMSTSKTLGTISCTMCYTKGRFRTKVSTEPLRDITVDNETGIGNTLREFLQVWEKLAPTRTQLLNEAKADVENITRELNSNLLILNAEVTLQNLSQRLNSYALQQLRNENRPYNEKIRWYIIRCESGLEQELKELYTSIDAYNILLDDITARGDLRTKEDFTKINEERSKLKSNAQEAVNRLSEAYQRLIL